jgi:hypothetical protein
MYIDTRYSFCVVICFSYFVFDKPEDRKLRFDTEILSQVRQERVAEEKKMKDREI